MAQKDSGQGAVKDPENDKRLKDNKGGQTGQGGSGQGQVKDPQNDMRLNENRDKK